MKNQRNAGTKTVIHLDVHTVDPVPSLVFNALLG